MVLSISEMLGFQTKKQAAAVQNGAKCPKENSVFKNLNGEIEPTKQGQIGNCYALAGVNALSYSEEGKKILKQSIKYNENTCNAEVTFKGVNKTYEITPKEFQSATGFFGSASSGDVDMNVLEIANNKFRLDVKKSDGKGFNLPKDLFNPERIKKSPDNNISDGGTACELTYLLSGNECEWNKFADRNGLTGDALKQKDDEIKAKVSATLDKIEKNPKEYVGTVAINTPTAEQAKMLSKYKMILPDPILGLFKAKQNAIVERHGYSIKSVKDDVVTLINPWDAAQEIKMAKKDLLDLSTTCYITATKVN